MGSILLLGGFSIELLILYCLGKQLTSKQASRRDFEANKQASKQRASKLGNQASRGVFCLLACLSASLTYTLGGTNAAKLSTIYEMIASRFGTVPFWFDTLCIPVER